MNRIEDIKDQMMELAKKEKRIRLCQSKIGELIFNLYFDGLIQDDNLKSQIKAITEEIYAMDVKVRMTDLMELQK